MQQRQKWKIGHWSQNSQHRAIPEPSLFEQCTNLFKEPCLAWGASVAQYFKSGPGIQALSNPEKFYQTQGNRAAETRQQVPIPATYQDQLDKLIKNNFCCSNAQNQTRKAIWANEPLGWVLVEPNQAKEQSQVNHEE